MILQSPAPTPWPSPKGPTPQVLFEQYFHDLVNKTWGNISPLYQLDTFDWFILLLYFAILGTLAVYGAYRIKQVIDFWRYKDFVPTPSGRFAEAELPTITIQLPLFNELYVVERLLKAVTAIDFSLTFFGFWENTHTSRLLTGALLGSVSVFYVMPGIVDVSLRMLTRRTPERRHATFTLASPERIAAAPSDYSAPDRRI